MFVASTLYSLARGTAASSDPPAAGETDNVRVKRTGRKTVPRAATMPPDPYYGPEPGSPPPPYEDINLTEAERAAQNVRRAKIALIDEILKEEDLYKLLGVVRTAKIEEIRRGFLMRSRVCHPDKFPDYPPSTLAFQRISLAYETLSKPSSRRMYDVSGRSDISTTPTSGSGSCDDGINDETLNGVLYNVFSEFMEGDFEMIRVMITALNEANPGLDLGEDAVHNFEGVFSRIRSVVLTGQKYFRIIRFELIRLYETQHALRQLSYFDVFGRLRLTLQLARVTLNIPMAIDAAMVNGSADDAEDAQPQAQEQADAQGEKQGERSGASAGNGTERDEDSESDTDEGEAHGASPEMAFGLADDAQEAARRAEAKARHRAAKAARAARREQREKRTPQGHIPEHSSAQTTEAWGLLGPAGRGLLGGIVAALESSESWVPGSSGTTAPEYT